MAGSRTAHLGTQRLAVTRLASASGAPARSFRSSMTRGYQTDAAKALDGRGVARENWVVEAGSASGVRPMRKPCETCVHAVVVPHVGMHCGRSGAQFHCDDERALGLFAALFNGACGAQGRFHAERAAAPPVACLPGSLAVDS